MKRKTKPSETIALLRRALKLARSSRETSFVVISMGHGTTIDVAGLSPQPVIAARAQHAVGKLLWELGAVGSLVPEPGISKRQLKSSITRMLSERRKAARRIRKS